MSSANEVYKCVNRRQNVNTHLAFFAFAVVTAKGVSDIQHWLQYYNMVFSYGSIPMRQSFRVRRAESNIFFPLFLFNEWFYDVFLCVKKIL